MRWIVVLVAAAGCGGAQTPERGEAFCQSYEENYLGACRQDCEASLEADDAAGAKRCASECAEDLKSDDTFSDSCR